MPEHLHRFLIPDQGRTIIMSGTGLIQRCESKEKHGGAENGAAVLH